MSARVALLCSVLVLLGGGCADPGSRRDAGIPDDASLDDGGDLDGAGIDAAAMDGGSSDAGAHDAATDGGMDAGPTDSSVGDSGVGDSGAADAASADAGPTDGGTPDAGTPDAGTPDAGTPDTGTPDAGTPDTGTPDAGTPDTGTPDTGTGSCISGATGHYAIRFRWLGSGAGSTAYVRYDLNDLPDSSRWHVSAASRSFSYTPVFDDPFLGDGGLDLSGTVFMDVELSTVGLSSIRNVTIAIRGRSFNTTASGSFHWMTFSGSGAAPTNLVANSAPYEWYGADATSAFVTGDGGALLRIMPGPSSNSLVVASVEICFDAD